MKCYLVPEFTSQKSFHRKAVVEYTGNKRILSSFNTIVAEIEGNKLKVFGLHSRTTTRHIKEFAMQNNFEFADSNDLLRRYGKRR